MNVAEFKNNFDGGSRSNRFIISGAIPKAGISDVTRGQDDINSIVVKAGSMPAVTLGILRVPFRGRVVKIPGDRTYEEWTFTVMDGFDGNSEHRNRFVGWNSEFNLHEQNVPGLFGNRYGQVDLNSDLFQTWTVRQLGLDGESRRKINLHKCWPVVVSEIALSYDNADTISEYTVTMAYDYLSGDGTGEDVDGNPHTSDDDPRHVE